MAQHDQRNLNAGEILLSSEVSTDIVIWFPFETDIVIADTVNQGDGTDLITWRTAQPFANITEPQLFFRLRVEGS